MHMIGKGPVEVLVLDAEGRPVSDCEVHLPVETSHPPQYDSALTTTRTDAAGVARFPWAAAVSSGHAMGSGVREGAYVQVSLDKQEDRKQRDFLARVEAEEHIVECHAMSGSHDYLLKVVARSMDHFSELSMERILKYPGVKNIESNFSLKAVKDSNTLPVR